MKHLLYASPPAGAWGDIENQDAGVARRAGSMASPSPPVGPCGGSQPRALGSLWWFLLQDPLPSSVGAPVSRSLCHHPSHFFPGVCCALGACKIR